MKTLISQKALCAIWGPFPITTKTMRRERIRWGLYPVAFDGLQPLFDMDHVRAAQARRDESRLAPYHVPENLLAAA